MLSARDQENRVYNAQAGAAAKQQQNQEARPLQPKTPGNRHAKTPLRIPLNDENAVRGLGGKSVLGNKTRGNENILTIGKGGNGVGKSKFVTPSGPQTARAPLGNKTTNAKTKPFQTPALREVRNSQRKALATGRSKGVTPKVESLKLEVLLDAHDPLSEEEDIEYCPPRQKDLPYESDVFPDGALNYDVLKPENRLKGYYNYYHNATDENGMTRLDREMKQKQEKRFKELDEQVKKDLDELVWNIDEEPTTKAKEPVTAPATKRIVRPGANTKAPSTIASRKAASALSMAPKTSNIQRKHIKTSSKTTGRAPSFMLPVRGHPLATKPVQSKTTTDAAAALAASRSTLGYNKGRSASSILHSRTKSEAPSRRRLVRSDNALSSSSDATITPARFANVQEPKIPDFAGIFDAREQDGSEEEDDGHLGGTSGPLQYDDDDDFQFDMNF